MLTFILVLELVEEVVDLLFVFILFIVCQVRFSQVLFMSLEQPFLH